MGKEYSKGVKLAFENKELNIEISCNLKSDILLYKLQVKYKIMLEMQYLI